MIGRRTPDINMEPACMLLPVVIRHSLLAPNIAHLHRHYGAWLKRLHGRGFRDWYFERGVSLVEWQSYISNMIGYVAILG